MSRLFQEYFRCPPAFARKIVSNSATAPPAGFFRFADDLTCYGRLSSGLIRESPADAMKDVSSAARPEGNRLYLPFDLDEVVENLRYERYSSARGVALRKSIPLSLGRKTYYAVRPFLPTAVRKRLQRMALRGWSQTPFPDWPIDQTVDRLFDEVMTGVLRASPGTRVPFIWFWPDGLASCAVMTHDVETAEGRDFCDALMDIDDSFCIKASFQLVPETRYEIPEAFLQTLRGRGFEINVHDYNHDGELFSDREQFLNRVARINAYGKKIQADGFRSGVLYRNLDWFDAFDYRYDMSVPNVGHLDPQPGGCCTTKPYFIGNMLEIPVVATQDYTLFNILGQYSTEVWEQQIDAVLQKHGLISFIIHPDYVMEKRARAVYVELLDILSELRTKSKLWIALPRQLNDWWRNRQAMRLVKEAGSWQIEGPDKHCARVAFAELQGDRLVYTFEKKSERPQPPTPLHSLAARPCANVSADLNRATRNPI